MENRTYAAGVHLTFFGARTFRLEVKLGKKADRNVRAPSRQIGDRKKVRCDHATAIRANLLVCV
jgi:hypothetical protein